MSQQWTHQNLETFTLILPIMMLKFVHLWLLLLFVRGKSACIQPSWFRLFLDTKDKLCYLDVCVLQGKIIVVKFNLQYALFSQQVFTLFWMLYTDTCLDGGGFFLTLWFVSCGILAFVYFVVSQIFLFVIDFLLTMWRVANKYCNQWKSFTCVDRLWDGNSICAL